MDFKPSDWFLGVTDLFAILLPGGILAYTLINPAQHYIFGLVGSALGDGAPAWIAFLPASYLLGHLIHMIAAWLDTLFDALGKHEARYKARMRDNRRDWRWWLGVKSKAGARHHAEHLREHAINHAEKAPPVDPEDISNINKWSRAVAAAASPAAATEIARYEADSKFFRSLVVVLLFEAAICAFHSAWFTAFLCLLLAPLCFARYCGQRTKGIEAAYTHLAVLYTAPPPGAPHDKPRPKSKSKPADE